MFLKLSVALRRGRPALGAVLCVGLVAFAAPAAADQTDPRLGPLFEALGSAPDAATADAAESEIWRIWHESGDPALDELLANGIRAMGENALEDAVEIFGQVVERAPGFAEGWNKRATAFFLAGDLEASVLDIERTLALEPRHFGAISGMGLIFLRQGDARGALRAFEAVLDVHPHARGAKRNVERLREALRDRRV